jgi:DNA-binding CsgD family transcriptional regulator
MNLKLVVNGTTELAANAGARQGGETAHLRASVLLRLLDEIDYGMMLVTSEGSVLFVNRQAAQELESDGPLGLIHGQLRAADSSDCDLLRLAIANAGRARRALVTVGEGGQRLSVATQPFRMDVVHSDEGSEFLALLTFGKRPIADSLRISLFARLQNITAAEARVLESLCDGVNPKDIAARQGVALSTVRSHISSMRVKTHSANIRELVSRVAALPPISSAMRKARTHRAMSGSEGQGFDVSPI